MNLEPRLLRLVREEGQWLGWTIFLGFLGAVLTVGQAWALSRVTGEVFLYHQSLEGVSRLLGILFLAIVFRAATIFGSEVAAGTLARRVKFRLRKQLVESILAMGPAYTRGERTGDLVNVAIDGIEALDAYFSQFLPQLALAVLGPLTLLVFVIPLDWISGLVLLVTAPLIPVFMILIGSLAETLTKRQWETLSRLSAHFLDVLQGLTTLKMLGRSKDQAGEIDWVSEHYRQATMGVLRVTFLSALVLEMVGTLATAVIAVEVGLRLLYGRMAFEQAFFVLLLAPEFYLPLRTLGARFHAGMAGVQAGKRIFEIIEKFEDQRRLTEDGGRETKRDIPKAKDRLASEGEEICFEKVSYAYDPGHSALENVSFTLRKGEHIAVVGLSGAGKSTLAYLLLKFITPENGRITLGRLPLEEIDEEELRSKISFLPQNPYLFNDSVLANIRLGKPEASIDEIIQAAKRAHAHEFIVELPQGYDTRIGERGARLSAGQAQRVALARAFLKDAPILILDESTANLDAETEAQIQANLEELKAGKTMLTIAHRLNTVVVADRILVIDKGWLVESGTHSQLLHEGGVYSRLVQEGERGIPLERKSMPGEVSINQQVVDEAWKTSDFAGFPGETPLAERGSRFPVFVRLLNFIWPYSGWVALSVLAGSATIGSSIGLMAASAYIISAAALQPSIAVLQVAIVGVRFFGIARGLFRYLERYISHQVTFKLLGRLRVWLYRALEPLAPACLVGYKGGDLLSRVVGDVATLENFYVRALAPPLVAILVTLVAGLYLASFSPMLVVGWLAFMGVGGLFLPWLAGLLGQSAGRNLVSARSSLSAALVDGIQGLTDLIAFGQEKQQAAQVEKAGQGLANAQGRALWVNGLQSALGHLVSNLGMWSVLVLAIPLVISDRIEGVFLAVVVLVALTSFEVVALLPQAAQYMGSNLAAGGRLFEIADRPPAVRDTEPPQPLPNIISLEFCQVTFSYPSFAEQILSDPDQFREDNLPVLKDVSFTMTPGNRLAIVGASGAGKTTIANLIMRFWEFPEGEILLGGKPLQCYRQDDIRRVIAVVPQNPYLFNATIRENLLLGWPEASQEEVIQAAKRAQIHDFIQLLPQGYETWVGEQGQKLSAGERQRIAIARALLRKAPLLILDEPTANLDVLNEREIMEAILAGSTPQSILLITHRLVGMEAMDEILVLRGGQVVERGVHARLLEKGGEYARMYAFHMRNEV